MMKNAPLYFRVLGIAGSVMAVILGAYLFLTQPDKKASHFLMLGGLAGTILNALGLYFILRNARQGRWSSQRGK